MLFSKVSRRSVMLGSVAAGVALALPARAEVKGLELLAPSNPGSGWDQTARALKTVMEETGLASGIQVLNVGGGGGTIGLAQFVTSKSRRTDAILLTGLAMVSGVAINKATVTLDQVRPLARLIGEYEVIVVPAKSPIKDLKQLVEMFKKDPGSVSWGAGSAGSADHLMLGVIAQATGVPATSINYIGHAGGGEALAAILGGHVTAGVSGYQEFASQIASGELRALGLSSPERIPGIDAPTFKEQGLAVDFVNWRGLTVPEKIGDKDFAVLAELVDKTVKSPKWQEACKARGWLSIYQPEAEFKTYLKENIKQVEGIVRAIGL